jgi:hypothetical protein
VPQRRFSSVLAVVEDVGRLSIIAAIFAGVLVACGSSPQPVAQASPPLTTQSVDARQTGNGAARIIASSITYQIDNSGSLVIHLSVQSQAATPETVTVRASLFDSGGNLIGDATGGQVQVPPSGSASIQLNGPAPHGTIASAVYEVSDVPAATPVVSTPVPTGTVVP